VSTPTALKGRYFGPALAFDEDTEITFLVDGKEYLGALELEISVTKAGDRVYLLDWFFDPTLDLSGRNPANPGFVEVGDLLAEKAFIGVDVRVVLNGGQFLGATDFASFYKNYVAMTDLRGRVPPGASTPPLANAVLYDWTGAEMSGSHHQKAAVVMRGGVLKAFVGGIDVNPLMLDAPPHNARPIPPPPAVGVPWGWHDGGLMLAGAATAAVYQNFAHRWEEAATLPPSALFIRSPGSIPPVKLVVYAPGASISVPAAPPQSTSNPTPDTSVQVLRSRYRTKLDRPGARKQPWRTAGGGQLTEVHETLTKAIGAAQRYIYVEDQFLADHPPLPLLADDTNVWKIVDRLIDSRTPGFSLFPLLEAAVKRKVKVIMVGSGYADPGDLFTGEKNFVLNGQLARLAAVDPSLVAVWRLLQETVHTKLMIIDDEFAAIGSANIQARSMIAVDSELHVAIVSAGNTVQKLRARLWAEHLAIDYASAPPALVNALDDLTDALGMWRTSWGTAGRWFTAGNPAGFTPAKLVPGTPRTQVVRAYVGPGATP
jgi:phosphatidylserine/phosphatidylglycerophosphate/cardiolipin synthase-like enzyme